ncbi:MAG: TPM domain-containing protein [Kiritimatiellaeota bacterium]|nr:TPM domain-containing protein [Kiritimatiellota bacterium]
MKIHEFISQLDEAKIVAAIAEAERKTSGEIRVYISHRAHADALAFAQKRFHQLGMTKTRHRNAALLYLAPRTRHFAIVGDSSVHEKCGDAFWQDASAKLGAALRQGDYTSAVIQTVGQLGALLAAHFPPVAGDVNELPNTILH